MARTGGIGEQQPLLPAPAAQVVRPAQRTRHFGLGEELWGYCLMALSTLGFSLMTFLVHVLSNPTLGFGLPSLYVVWFRSVVQLAGATVYILVCVDKRYLFSSLSKSQIGSVIARGVVGTAGFICLFKSLSLIALGDAICIFFLSPMLTMLLAAVFLGEPVHAVEAISAAVAFAGVALVAKPSAFDSSAAALALASASSPDRTLGVLYALAAAFLGASAYTLVRSLGASVHFILHVASLGLVATLATTLMLGRPLLALAAGSLRDPLALALLVLQGLGALAGQLALNLALQFCSGVGVMIRNLDVPLAYLLGVALLGEVPSRASTVGALLVLGSVGAISWRQASNSR
jgi:drug/metabolite transporter (DMT)-like permease